MRMVLRLASNTCVADIDIVIARGEIATGGIAQCDVVAAGGVAIERKTAIRRVVAAGLVIIERFITIGRVFVAGYTSGEQSQSANQPVAVLPAPVYC